MKPCRRPPYCKLLWFGLLFAVSYPAVAADYVFVTNSDNTVTITDYTGPGGDVTIPSALNGLTVTSLENYSFQDSTQITNLTIPATVTNIGAGAFQDCVKLVSITIPDSVVRIGGSAFSRCFNLRSVTIPNSITTIEASLFDQCSDLVSVTIPNSVTKIRIGAFGNCFSLTNLAIPASVLVIEHDAILNCRVLAAIDVDPLNPAYSSVAGVLFDKNLTRLISCPGGKAGEYGIPLGVSTVESEAFNACHKLTGISIPDTVLTIRVSAFTFCTELLTLNIPSSVTNISLPTFSYCSNLPAITVDEANPFYRSVDGVLFDKNLSTLYAFPGGKTGAYSIPDSVNRIYNSAFKGATRVASIRIPDSVHDIGDSAFYGCTNLTSMTMPGSVDSLQNYTFGYCRNLEALYCEGDAPAAGFNMFPSANKVIVYYLPGTAGWGPTYGGRPTAMWLPQVLVTDTNFGVRTNHLGFNINWGSGMTVVVETCTNLANPAWTPLQTNVLSSNKFYFNDAEAAIHPARYYRVRWP